jgi:Putative collagen-binding domain of a collagenase
LVAYVPPAYQGSFTVNTTGMGDTIDAIWYDPTNGTYSKISDSPFNNQGTHQFTPQLRNSAGQQDWVLVLRKGPSKIIK